jgi:DNA invertase Pin-like site-specific DNA recombinase
LKENWYALFVATQREISVEQALKRMGVKTGYVANDKKKETRRMIDLKRKGYSYRKISRMYGMNYSTVRWRIIRAERKEMMI